MTKTHVFSPNPSEKDIDHSLKEITEHGNSLFPIAVHYTNHEANRKNMIHTHWHREIEILYIASGKMEVIIEGKHFIAEKDDIIFIPPNLLHEAINFEQNPCAFFAIVFDSFFIESHFSDIVQQSYIDPIIQHTTSHIFQATDTLMSIEDMRMSVTAIIEEFALKEPYYELSLKANLLQFLRCIYREKDNLFNFDQYYESKDELTSYRCKKIVLFIEEHYQEHISLEMISNHMGFSKEYFCRFFKKNFRMSFFKYLNESRIKKAEYLLLNTQHKIIDIAFETGFEDANYFTTVFKKETGLTPSAYRKAPNNLTLL